MGLTRLHRLAIAIALLALSVSASIHFTRRPAEPLQLAWAALLPPGAESAAAATGVVYDRVTPESVPVPDPRALQPKDARVNADLDGKDVSIAGYVVPLEFDGIKVKQFLLVPFYGACIHVPPPPANQIILVRLAQAVEAGAESDPVVVTGRLRVASSATTLADAGYQIAGAALTAMP